MYSDKAIDKLIEAIKQDSEFRDEFMNRISRMDFCPNRVGLKRDCHLNTCYDCWQYALSTEPEEADNG
ncbi:MAG: hypothetical protein H6Q71_1726 [Firmicutes bacterium]|nr:hypothetical protein [Bacillota bacterium]